MTIKKVQIKDEYVNLGQFLKIVDLIDSGGEAKVFLLTHDVYVNGEKEERRGRKLYREDRIKIAGEEYEIC